ncbi:hypothetical protein BY996DRAFT_6918459 [Phakopsora pachyrhizi]|nr:hypothetical protein BY996DRAFT_6918459 [Phakopsora pachyrhizi]
MIDYNREHDEVAHPIHFFKCFKTEERMLQIYEELKLQNKLPKADLEVIHRKKEAQQNSSLISEASTRYISADNIPFDQDSSYGSDSSIDQLYFSSLSSTSSSSKNSMEMELAVMLGVLPAQNNVQDLDLVEVLQKYPAPVEEGNKILKNDIQLPSFKSSDFKEASWSQDSEDFLRIFDDPDKSFSIDAESGSESTLEIDSDQSNLQLKELMAEVEREFDQFFGPKVIPSSNLYGKNFSTPEENHNKIADFFTTPASEKVKDKKRSTEEDALYNFEGDDYPSKRIQVCIEKKVC